MQAIARKLDYDACEDTVLKADAGTEFEGISTLKAHHQFMNKMIPSSTSHSPAERSEHSTTTVNVMTGLGLGCLYSYSL